MYIFYNITEYDNDLDGINRFQLSQISQRISVNCLAQIYDNENVVS